MTDLIDISNDMNDAFYANKDFKRGSVLIFNYEGSETHLKIIRLNRKSKVCLCEEIKLLTTEQTNDILGEE